MDQFKEYVMTGLRTKWGCSIDKIKQEFGTKGWLALEQQAKGFIDEAWMVKEEGHLRMTDQGKLHADGIAAEMFR